MVELMRGELLPRCKQHTVRLRGQRGIAEPHKPPGFYPLPRQDARHRVGRAVRVLKRLAEVEKAAALGCGGQAVFDRGL